MLTAESFQVREQITVFLHEIAWKQWAYLGANVELQPSEPLNSVIDPEALVLLTLAIQDEEPRLRDFVLSWAVENSRYLSTQRFETLRKSFPPIPNIEEFKQVCFYAGDKRWKVHAPKNAPKNTPFRPNKMRTMRLDSSKQIWLKYRIGFGVNAKIDCLCLLEGKRNSALTVQEVAQLLGYSLPTVRQALDDLAKAALITKNSQQKPALYHALNHVLLFEGMIEWHSFGHYFPLLLHARTWLDQYWDSEYLRSRRARALYESCAFPAFYHDHFVVPDPANAAGTAYNAVFEDTLSQFIEQLRLKS